MSDEFAKDALNALLTKKQQELQKMKSALAPPLDMPMTSEEILLAVIREQMDRHFAEIRQIFVEGFERIDRRFDRIDANLTKMEEHLDSMEENIAAMQEHVIAIREGPKWSTITRFSSGRSRRIWKPCWPKYGL